jgi:hypothetical protein
MIVQFNVQQRLKYATLALKVCWISTIFSILCYECFLNCDFVSAQHKFVHFSYFFFYYFDPLVVTFYIRPVVTWWVLIFLACGPSYKHLWLHTYKTSTHAISTTLQQFWKPRHQNQLLLNKSLHSYYKFATKDWVEGAKGWRVHY